MLHLVEKLGGVLLSQGLQLGTAESCTGGLLAHWLTSVAGCSDWYRGGIVAYANETKIALLGVSANVLREIGAVSAEVAGAMAQGVCERVPGVSLGVGITGIAGPGGGSVEKPVGLVYLGLAHGGKLVETAELHVIGTRKEIQIAAGKAALEMVYDYVMRVDKRTS